MSYIGNEPSQTLASPTSQYFNGTGSQTAFTLNRLVNVSEDLEVFVNNIQQEPGVGKSYTATGSTLTFDAAPSAGTNNVYVVYRGLAEITTRLEHDPNAALAATTGTFTGDLTVDTNTLYVDSTNNKAAVGTTSPSTKFHVESAGANYITSRDSTSGGVAGVILQNGSDTRGIRINGNSLQLHDLSANLTRLNIDASGRVTMPYQPSFFAQWNAGGDASLSANTKVPAATMLHNVGNHYNTSQYRFTAPVAGIYLFSGQMWSKTNNNNARFSFRKNGSTRLAQHGGAGVPTDTGQQGIVIVSLNANDYVEMFGDDFSHNVHAGGTPHTYWTGHLLG